MSPLADRLTDAGLDSDGGDLLPDREGATLLSDPLAGDVPALAGPEPADADAPAEG